MIEDVQSNISHLIIESTVGTILLWILALAFLRFTRVSSPGIRAAAFSLPLFIPVTVTTVFHVLIPWRPSSIPNFKPLESLICDIVEFLPLSLRIALILIVAVAFIVSVALAFRQWLAWRQTQHIWLCQQEDSSQLRDLCNTILDTLASGLGIAIPRLILEEGGHVRCLSIGRRGYIFVPRSLMERLDDDELKALLAHEMAHIARIDGLWGCLARICRNLMLFNPLAHLALSRFEREQEYAADDLAIRRGGDRLALASCLLKGYRFRTCRLAMAGTGLLGNRSGLKKRIRRIMDMRNRQLPSRVLWLALLLLTGMATIALALAF